MCERGNTDSATSVGVIGKPFAIDVTFGLAKIGAVNVSVNWRLAPAEMAQIIDDAQARVVIVGPDFFGPVEAIEGDYTGEGYVRMTVDLIDAAGEVVRFSRDVYLDGTSYTSLEPVPQSIVPVKANIKIVNLSTTPGDSVFIDMVAVIPVRLGTPLPRGAEPQPLPLPPAAG